MTYIISAYVLTGAAIAGLWGTTLLRLRRAQAQMDSLHGS